MSSPFDVRQHTFAGQHIREYPAALATHQEDALTIAAKSYTPHEVANGTVTGDLTVIGFHANASPKEAYEPFFEALYKCLKSRHGLTISSIWIADQAHQGDSAVMNDELVANDSHWFDHSRDVIQMVNTFRQHMRRPLVAVGHSMGGTQAVATATFHPRLFEAVVLIDTAMTMTMAGNIRQMFTFAWKKPEKFATSEEVVRYVKANPLFKTWDRRAVERYIDSAFHDAPTALHPDHSIKFKSSIFSEIRNTSRPNPDKVTFEGSVTEAERYQYPDIGTDSPLVSPVYNPHTGQAYRWLPSLRPAALYILGEGSVICPPESLEHRTNITGTGPGGSGGVAAGNVKAVTLNGGHFLPMTNIEGTAETAGEWVAERIEKWRRQEEGFWREWERKSLAEKKKPDGKTEGILRKWNGVPYKNAKALPDGGRSRL